MWPDTEMAWLLYIETLIMFLTPSQERFLISRRIYLQSTSWEDILIMSKNIRLVMRSLHGAPISMSNLRWTTSRTLFVLSRPSNMPRCPLTIRLSQTLLTYATMMRRRNTGNESVICNGTLLQVGYISFMLTLFSRDISLILERGNIQYPAYIWLPK